jgi:predicted transposase YbfD/YdcC
MIKFYSVIEMSMNEIFNMYFGIIDDERDQANVRHPLVDILKLVMLAVLCGMDELDKIVDYGKNKQEFLRKEFEINAIPSKSTLTRIFSMLNPKWLGLSTVCILKMLIKEKHTQIMLDGKAIKSTDAIKTIEKMMNIVTAYTDTGISLGQMTVDNKSNEIPAVRDLIEMLDVEGMIVTADAMHCQKETAEKIIENKGDYVLQLKANQGSFYEDVYAMFDDDYMNEADKDCEYETFITLEKSHGRIEKRTCYVLNELEFFTDYLAEWKGLKKIFAVKREVEKDGKKSTEISCYLSSKNTSAEKLLSYTRKHWQIESMHHILDVSYDEDKCKVLSQRAQENFNIFRKAGISIHKNYLKGKKKTVKSNMFNCLLNDRYLIEILQYYVIL